MSTEIKTLDDQIKKAEFEGSHENNINDYKVYLCNTLVLLEEMCFESREEFIDYVNKECGIDRKTLIECGFLGPEGPMPGSGGVKEMESEKEQEC